MPLRVPLYDEGATDLQLDAWQQAKANGQPNLEKPEPLYQWVHRPEFQFTRYDLTVSEVRRTDVTGRTEDLYPMEIPVVAGDDQMLDLFYEIFAPLQSDGTLLQALETYSYNGDQELVFALGEQELIAHVGADGQITFDNLEEIFASLNAEDLQTLLIEKNINLRLYANNDAANVLWEFGIDPGLSVYYRLPYEEHSIANDPDAPEDYPVFRTLGGVRLKLHYDPLDGEYVTGYQWEIHTTGKTTSGTGTPMEGKFKTSYYSNVDDLVANTQTVFWEPSDWAYYGDGDSEFDFEGTLTLTVAGGLPPIVKKFRIDRRQLGSRNIPLIPMKGSDVAMLEEMLWQLGVSPQMGSPGGMGARIKSVRYIDKKGNEVATTDCQGKAADDRSKFYPGFVGCPLGRVSTEVMLRRFQARNNTGTGHTVWDANMGQETPRHDMTDETGQVDNDTLVDMGRDWALYMKSFVALSDVSFGLASPIIDDSDARLPTWLDSAIAVWDNGAGTHVPAAEYTAEFHANILQLAGITVATPDVNDRRALLRNWMIREMPFHWGTNSAKKGGKPYQPTPYRMAEGYSDEHGSLSFSQLLYAHRFGANPCTVHAELEQGGLGLNLYHPEGNMKSFTVHTAADAAGAVSCEGGMHRAFVRAEDDTARLGLAYNVAGAKITDNIDDLVGYRHGTGAFHAITLNAAQDNYERLAAVIAYYNSPSNLVGKYRRSWPSILKYLKNIEGSTGNNADAGVYHSGRYSIDVRSAIFGDNLRTYIWKGGKYPATLPDGTPHPTAGQDWCFAYGEKEWVDGKLWEETKNAADNFDIAGRPQTPVGQISCG